MKAFSDLEQSKKLAEILPLESADNVIVSIGDREGVKTITMPKETLNILRTPFADIRNTIPCWSFTALFSTLPEGHSSILTKSFNGKDYYCKLDGKPIEIMADNPVDACYEMILMLNELNLL